MILIIMDIRFSTYQFASFSVLWLASINRILQKIEMLRHLDCIDDIALLDGLSFSIKFNFGGRLNGHLSNEHFARHGHERCYVRRNIYTRHRFIQLISNYMLDHFLNARERKAVRPGRLKTSIISLELLNILFLIGQE